MICTFIGLGHLTYLGMVRYIYIAAFCQEKGVSSLYIEIGT